MLYFKRFMKSIGLCFSVLLISLLVLTVFSYFNIFNSTFTNIFKIIILIFSVFSAAFYLGMYSKKKGYLEGVKFSTFFITFSIVLSLVFKVAFNSKRFIYYGIVILASLLGSVLGINKKKEN